MHTWSLSYVGLSLVLVANAMATPPLPAKASLLARYSSVQNKARFSLFGDVLPTGPVIDGCKVVPCSVDLGTTAISCVGAVAEGGSNAVADLSCLARILKDVEVVPMDCANCPEAIEKQLNTLI
ncbi:hypothetical protein GQ53DRAFT_824754 [Thozetella sp. PMI_491]|nr:hypothetical protein GQ53DRAFT_824754 [Thozetella sp. PMI_491]